MNLSNSLNPCLCVSSYLATLRFPPCLKTPSSDNPWNEKANAELVTLVVSNLGGIHDGNKMAYLKLPTTNLPYTFWDPITLKTKMVHLKMMAPKRNLLFLVGSFSGGSPAVSFAVLKIGWLVPKPESLHLPNHWHFFRGFLYVSFREVNPYKLVETSPITINCWLSLRDPTKGLFLSTSYEQWKKGPLVV